MKVERAFIRWNDIRYEIKKVRTIAFSLSGTIPFATELSVVPF